MVRIESLRTIFKNITCLVSNRDPVAFCSSSLFRNHLNQTHLSLAQRQVRLKKLALIWVKRSSILMELILTQGFMSLTYEKFCEAPDQLKHAVERASAKAIHPSSNAFLRIKDYPPSQISNRNEEQISRLSKSEIDAIVMTLKTHKELTDFFGYSPEYWQNIC